MQEKGFPWDSVDGDIRTLSAANLATIFKTLIDDGVFDYENDFLIEIVDSSSKIINIKSGTAWISGRIFPFNGVHTISLPDGEIATSEARPGLIILKCREENEYMDFDFQVKYITDGTEPTLEENEIELYRFKYSSDTLQNDDFDRVVVPAKPKNMYINALSYYPNSTYRVEYGRKNDDDNGYVAGLHLYAGDAQKDFARICQYAIDAGENLITGFTFSNGLVLNDYESNQEIVLTPKHFYVQTADGKQPFQYNAEGETFTVMRCKNGELLISPKVYRILTGEGVIPFEHNTGDDSFTAIRWGKTGEGDKNTQVVCKEDALMCYINGVGTVLGAWTSDKSLKKNIKNAQIDALELVKLIQHKQFEWKQNNEHQSIGYVANQLAEVHPELVIKVPQENGETLLQINEQTLIPLLSKAIQEQNELIKNMDERLKILEEKVSNND